MNEYVDPGVVIAVTRRLLHTRFLSMCAADLELESYEEIKQKCDAKKNGRVE
jgi:hypothetical protein